MKSVLQQPIAYFKVDNGSNPIENNHNFFRWEGMYTVENPQCREYDGKYCVLINGVKEFNLTFWRNTTFISQNSTYHNYLTLLKQAKPQNVECDKGYKQCGILDSFNQKLCLLENETCPLNQIELSNSSTPSDIFTNKDAVNTTLLNDNKTYLHTSNAEINSLVIIEIIIGPESFCFDFEERKLGPPYYGFERSSSDGNCTEYGGYEIDYHYVSIDNQSKMNVYNENEISTKIQDFIKHPTWTYPLKKLNNSNLHLYKRNYFGFDLTFLWNQELNEESFNFVKKYNGAIFALSMIVGVTNLLWLLFSAVIFAEACDNAPKGKDLIKFMGIICIDFPVTVPLISVAFGLTLSSTNSILKCADAPIAEKFLKPQKLDFTLGIISFGLYMLMIVIKVTIVVIANYLCCCKKQKENKEETQQQLL